MAPATTPETWLRIVEAALLSAPGALPVSELRKLFDEDPGPDLVRRLLDELRAQWFEAGRAVELVQLASGWRFQTRPEYQVTRPPEGRKTAALLARGRKKRWRSSPIASPSRAVTSRTSAAWRSRQRLENPPNRARWVDIVGHRDTPGGRRSSPPPGASSTDGLRSLTELPALTELEKSWI